MNWLGDYPEDFTTVAIYFTTHDVNGAPVAPLTGYEAADVTIYKNGSATQKTSTNGVTMTSPFDSVVGLHCVVIDTSNDTGDSGFWTTGGGGVYSVILNPDTETVAGQTTLKVIGTFGICLAPALRPTTAGRTLDVSATGEAGVDWANVGSPTTSLALSGTTIATTQKVDVDSIKTDATSAADLAKTTRAIGRGTATTGGSTTSIPTSAFTPAGAVADQFKNRVVLFDADTTTTALRGQAATISASSNSATPTFTVAAMTTAPASGDTFSVL